MSQNSDPEKLGRPQREIDIAANTTSPPIRRAVLFRLIQSWKRAFLKTGSRASSGSVKEMGGFPPVAVIESWNADGGPLKLSLEGVSCFRQVSGPHMSRSVVLRIEREPNH